MSSSFVRKFLTATRDKTSKSIEIFWLVFSLVFSIGTAVAIFSEAFGHQYVLQDDARQHVFWMMRFVDPQLFPNDLIADYFQSVAPLGYSTLYQVGSMLGLSPFVFSKILPVILGAISTAYGFGVSMQILPVPFAGFVSTLVLNQTLWCKGDLISATPRAFLYPLFLAFLYYFLKKRLIATSLSIFLTGLFYPQYLLVEGGIVTLSTIDYIKTKKRIDVKRCSAYLVIVVAMLVFYAAKTSDFSPVIDVETAKQLPGFFKGGRIYFFNDNFVRFWTVHPRSGYFPKGTAMTLWIGLLLPVLLLFSKTFKLLRCYRSNQKILLQIFITATLLFFLSHALLFKLHLPNRYSGHTGIIVLSFASGLVITASIDAALNARKWRFLKTGFALIVSLSIAIFPIFLEEFPKTNTLVRGKAEALYEFFQKQPKDISIASISKEADNLPTFAKRSVLVAQEYAIPYHYGYYQKFRKRAVTVFEAQYSPNLETVKQAIDRYDIDFWLLDFNAFAPDYFSDRQWGSRWHFQFLEHPESIVRLEREEKPALSLLEQQCKVFETDLHRVLSASCILSAK
ncbi:MAG: hypothetical protein J7641_11980 [Cyanobacteria bacterium SID2]|nr:hypothetical protein [Cyanobacteria bacterium SID2]